MLCLGFIFMILSLLSLLMFISNLLSVLILLEFMSLSLFMMISSYLIQGGVMELVFFFVIVVGEALLGLILMVMKVLLSGDDMMDIVNVI